MLVTFLTQIKERKIMHVVVNLLLIPIQTKVPCKHKHTEWIRTGHTLILLDALPRMVSVNAMESPAFPAKHQDPQPGEITVYLFYSLFRQRSRHMIDPQKIVVQQI